MGVPFPFSVEALRLYLCLGPELPDERPLPSERGGLLGSRSETRSHQKRARAGPLALKAYQQVREGTTNSPWNIRAIFV